MAKGKTVSTCDSGVWTPLLEDLQCLEAVALITGGFDDSRKLQEVEVWKGDGQRKRLSDLPRVISDHSVDYIDGALLLCGGYDRRSRNKCLKGEYQPSTKGILVHSHSACSAQTMQSMNLILIPDLSGYKQTCTVHSKRMQLFEAAHNS